MIKALLLDVDGVIAIGEMFSIQLARELNLEKSLMDDFFHNYFPGCLLGKLDLKEELAKHLDLWGWKSSVEALMSYWFENENVIDYQLLTEIKSLKLPAFLLTNQEKYRADYLMQEMGLSNYFDKIFFSAGLGVKKPDPEIYRRVLNELPEYKPDELLFWDDNPVNVQAAKNMGINSEVYTDFPNFRQKTAAYLSFP